MAAKKSTAKKSAPKNTGKRKVAKVMDEFKHHELRSGRSGKKVTNPKQAIAIGLNEARQAGANIPKKGAAKKSAGKKAAAPAAKKKSTGKKAATKRTTGARKTATKKASRKR
jgi:Family of unknown function (DUF6496)